MVLVAHFDETVNQYSRGKVYFLGVTFMNAKTQVLARTDFMHPIVNSLKLRAPATQHIDIASVTSQF